MGSVTIKAKELESFVADIFATAGCSKEEGGRIGRYLVSANLSGHDSHGVVRVPRYASQKKSGTVIADVTVDVLVDTPVIAVVDGKYGFGQTVTPQAVQIGIDKCLKNGLSAVTLRNAGHVGRVGDWAEMAAEAGLVSVHFVNASGSVLVAPYGGVERRFSTAPYCVGVPRPGEDPLVLDFATSIVAEGKVLVTSQGGKKLPEGALTRICSTATTRRPARAITARAPAPSVPSATTRARASPSCARSWAARCRARVRPIPSAAVSPTACCPSTSIPRCSTPRASSRRTSPSTSRS
jgi:LDH2 family malate/lactate/ureidoglycolate dehydrogenase